MKNDWMVTFTPIELLDALRAKEDFDLGELALWEGFLGKYPRGYNIGLDFADYKFFFGK